MKDTAIHERGEYKQMTTYNIQIEKRVACSLPPRPPYLLYEKHDSYHRLRRCIHFKNLKLHRYIIHIERLSLSCYLKTIKKLLFQLPGRENEDFVLLHDPLSLGNWGNNKIYQLHRKDSVKLVAEKEVCEWTMSTKYLEREKMENVFICASERGAWVQLSVLGRYVGLFLHFFFTLGLQLEISISSVLSSCCG